MIRSEIKNNIIKFKMLLTTKKRLQTEEFDLFLALYKVRCTLVWRTGA